ncbi:MAG: 6,7-dimethyl-8-ribityllumazine synthase [Calditrichaeota bacterium]|jgi:6,7-dimethyl-8-ribityllumazine synthase|nr:6,7-dimethyl-8-ribityllumazine synthase [Calditrichota bacterium]MBT7617241.1 6,7-dimethyl-8-ribityllumazine synthase [Calditrichota bacterium]MBT7789907.1 6,7-dimethyl-8-ribityllumazine synthase [Calditrichota bacterium]
MKKSKSTENTVYEGKLNAKGLKVAFIVSRFNDFISQRLVEGAIDCLERHSEGDAEYSIIKVPGAYDIPATTGKVVDSGKFDAVVTLGAVIRGATPHFDYVAAEVAKGVAQVAMSGKVPISFGVLTTDSIEQAIERAGTKSGNKGWDATQAVIELANLWKQL